MSNLPAIKPLTLMVVTETLANMGSGYGDTCYPEISIGLYTIEDNPDASRPPDRISVRKRSYDRIPVIFEPDGESPGLHLFEEAR